MGSSCELFCFVKSSLSKWIQTCIISKWNVCKIGLKDMSICVLGSDREHICVVKPFVYQQIGLKFTLFKNWLCKVGDTTMSIGCLGLSCEYPAFVLHGRALLFPFFADRHGAFCRSSKTCMWPYTNILCKYKKFILSMHIFASRYMKSHNCVCDHIFCQHWQQTWTIRVDTFLHRHSNVYTMRVVILHTC